MNPPESNARRVTGREWRVVLIVAVLLMAITSIPYLVGYASARDGSSFGGFMFGVEDQNSYLAKMRQGAAGGWGDWQFHLVYTAERHEGAFLFTPYLFLGKVAALLTGSPDPTHDPALNTWMLFLYHLARIGFGILLIAVSYRFAALFLPRGSMRWLAIVLIAFGGGLGWLLVVLGQDNWLGSSPIDFILPEGYSFFLLYGLPHLSVARAALLGGFMCMFRAMSLVPQPRSEIYLTPQPPLRPHGEGEPEASSVGSIRVVLPYSLLAGVCWLIMGLCVPFYVAVLYALLGVWGLAALIRHRRFPTRLFIGCVIAAIIPAPLLIYQLVVFSVNPIMAAFSRQNYLPSPNPLHYVAGYIVLAVPAIFGVIWAWRRGKRRIAYLLLPAWVVAAPVLAYVPVSVQRRLLEGIFVPLCILAVVGLRFAIAPRLRTGRITTRRVWRRLAALTLLLTLPTTVLLLLVGTLGVSRPTSVLFHQADELTALDWLNGHAPDNAVVLSTEQTGNYLAARTNLRGYIGHGPETLDAAHKKPLVDQFFDGLIPLSAFANPAQDPIRYVIYGPFESNRRDPTAISQWSAGLQKIYEVGSYAIYAVS